MKEKLIYKRYLGVLIVCSALVTSGVAQASQEGVNPSTLENELLINPLATAFGIFGAFVEHSLNRKLSVGVGYQYFSNGTLTTSSGTAQYDAYLDYNFARDEWDSPWMKIGYGLNHRQVRLINGRTVLNQRASLLLESGYRWRIAEEFSTRLGAGVSYTHSSVNHPFEPQMVWQVGYRF